MKPRILIPVVHRPLTIRWGDPTDPPLRIVPHYAAGIGLREGDETQSLACSRGYEASPIYNENYKALPTEWIPAPLWSGPLAVVGYHGGRSSSCYAVRIEADDGAEPVEGLMSCATYLGVIPRVVHGIVPSGRWTAIKRGQNYLIEPA